jgi:hypothetical protein
MVHMGVLAPLEVSHVHDKYDTVLIRLQAEQRVCHNNIYILPMSTLHICKCLMICNICPFSYKNAEPQRVMQCCQMWLSCAWWLETTSSVMSCSAAASNMTPRCMAMHRPIYVFNDCFIFHISTTCDWGYLGECGNRQWVCLGAHLAKLILLQASKVQESPNHEP